MQRVRNAIAAAACVLLLAACASASPGPTRTPSASPSAVLTPSPSASTAEPVRRPDGDPVTIASGLRAPWSFTWTSGGALLVSERDTNRIVEVLADGGTREAGVIAGITNGGEGGLLGLAVDGEDRLYVYSTGEDGNRVERYPTTGEPGGIGLGPGTTILSGIPSAGNHNGGRIAFGPDGMLYAGTGDAGDPAAAQDPGSLAGKILRMTPDGTAPADNPFAGSLVWSLGHRNVQGLAWTSDGTMLASEFGQSTWDELNVIEPGCNYGWPVVEGMAGDPAFCDPVQGWRTGAASPSGIAVAGGAVFVANLRGEVLRMVPLGDPAAHEDVYQSAFGRLRDVAEGPDGRLWFLTNETDGRGSPAAGDDRLLAVPLR